MFTERPLCLSGLCYLENCNLQYSGFRVFKFRAFKMCFLIWDSQSSRLQSFRILKLRRLSYLASSAYLSFLSFGSLWDLLCVRRRTVLIRFISPETSLATCLTDYHELVMQPESCLRVIYVLWLWDGPSREEMCLLAHVRGTTSFHLSLPGPRVILPSVDLLQFRMTALTYVCQLKLEVREATHSCLYCCINPYVDVTKSPNNRRNICFFKSSCLLVLCQLECVLWQDSLRFSVGFRGECKEVYRTMKYTKADSLQTLLTSFVAVFFYSAQ
jgi:hypothetical protein